jgi:pyridoxal phosphate enzyme (YggS family)
MSYIKENLKNINIKIQKALKENGRGPDEARLIAVTKTYGVDVINEAIDCGVTDIGENRVQEIMEKYDSVKPVRWHLIGHLQKNKVKYIIDKVYMIHSVDSFELAKEIDRLAKKHNKEQKILLEVNVSGEESKFGIVPGDCIELCKKISEELANVKIEGLMTVAPFVDDEAVLEGVFSGLKNLAEDISESGLKNVDMNQLSMGMTNDFHIAVRCGATMVRIGTAIFGKRDYTNQ